MTAHRPGTLVKYAQLCAYIDNNPDLTMPEIAVKLGVSRRTLEKARRTLHYPPRTRNSIYRHDISNLEIGTFVTFSYKNHHQRNYIRRLAAEYNMELFTLVRGSTLIVGRLK